VTNVANFVAPANATNCLFVMWVNNADFVLDMQSFGQPETGTNLATWTTNINLHLTNQFKAITNLYAKGCRTLIAPNAADITSVPYYNTSSKNYLTFVRQQVVNYNSSYAVMLKQISTTYPDLTIYSPDIFSLLNNAFTNAASYGLTNTLVNGQPMDAIDAYHYGFPVATTNGYGTNYIFWGPFGDPTAKFHAVIADTVQQMISPVQFSGLTQVGSSNRLDVVNMPVGMSGSVLSVTNLTQVNWLTNSPGFTGTNMVQSVFAPASGAQNFYRLLFPWQWTWP
jgi:phospholipase/lecithinase/hemolysin